MGNQHPEHPERAKSTKVEMDDMPELPFEKVLSYLSLEDLLKSRGVSRSWRNMIDSFKVKTLGYSSYPKDFIYEKNRWISGSFSHNFVVSTQFEDFFKTFGQTILSHLKHLRLYGLDLNAENRTAAFSRALNSFSQLEELDILYFTWKFFFGREPLELNLPMLKRIQLKSVLTTNTLTLNAPMLKKVQLYDCDFLELNFVYGESVEWLFIGFMDNVKVEKLKNLKILYIGSTLSIVDFPLLFGLKHLKAIHLTGYYKFRELFELKQQHGRADLQIYRLGCLLDGPDDPAIHSGFDQFNGKNFLYLAANPSSLADEIPFWRALNYTAIEHLSAESQATILDRLTDLDGICLVDSVQDTERLLNFLKTFSYKFQFENLLFYNDQSQSLFDRLPEHCAVQKLLLGGNVSDFEFLFRLEHLVELWLFDHIDSQLICRAFNELHFLQAIFLKHFNVKVERSIETPRRYRATEIRGSGEVNTPDLNEVIRFIEKKPKVSSLWEWISQLSSEWIRKWKLELAYDAFLL